MKTILILAASLLLYIPFTNAQTYIGYGTTSQGGMYGYGVIFSYEPVANKYTIVYNFDSTNGNSPYGSLTKASSGIFYGVTTYGGAYNYGVLYSFDPNTNKETTLVNFDSIDNGAFPLSTLMQASNGLLYGLTYEGGNNNKGTLFSFDPVSCTETTLLHFNGSNGASPIGSLLQASNGLLYGMTFAGGSYNEGVIYSYNIQTAQDSVLVNFNGANGSVPYGSLVQHANGLLYGMAYGGGAYNKGVLFSYNISSGKETVQINFNGSSGAYPFGSLTKDPNGTLYGMTSEGGSNNLGVLFSYEPGLSSETVLFSFNGVNGHEPYGNVALDSNNHILYGMTHWGGNSSEGVLFSYVLSFKAETPLVNLDLTTGDYPCGDLVFIGSNVPNASNTPLANGNNISLYPNPAKNNAYIIFNETGKHFVEVYDETGKKLTTMCFTDARSLFPVNIFPSGLYFLKMYNQDLQYISSTKLIIQ